jgi:hypothetical protein
MDVGKHLFAESVVLLQRNDLRVRLEEKCTLQAAVQREAFPQIGCPTCFMGSQIELHYNRDFFIVLTILWLASHGKWIPTLLPDSYQSASFTFLQLRNGEVNKIGNICVT